MACYLSLYGILTGLNKSSDHPSAADDMSPASSNMAVSVNGGSIPGVPSYKEFYCFVVDVRGPDFWSLPSLYVYII